MKNKTIEEKMTELNKLVAWFDGDEFVLEQAIDRFKEAERLAEEVKQDLESVKNDIKVIAKRFDKDTE